MKVMQEIMGRNILKLIIISIISLVLLSDSASVQGQTNNTTPPAVVTVNPANGTTGIGTATDVIAAFNEALDPATVNASTFELRDGSGNLVAATVSYDVASLTATLNPTTSHWQSGRNYTANDQGGHERSSREGPGGQCPGQRLHLVIHHRDMCL